jgi:hypothetical protein
MSAPGASERLIRCMVIRVAAHAAQRTLKAVDHAVKIERLTRRFRTRISVLRPALDESNINRTQDERSNTEPASGEGDVCLPSFIAVLT